MENQPQEESKKLYFTKGNLFIIGRSIAVNLDDAQLDHDPKIQPHMTVLFSNSGYKNTDLVALQSLEKVFRNTVSSGEENHGYSFSLEVWGKQSSKIIGGLNDLCLYLRKECKISQDEARIPHVQLKSGSERRRHK